MTTKQEYLNLITTEHSLRPKFIASLGATIEPLSKAQSILRDLKSLFDLDEATGVQLDTIGLWVGIARRVPVSLDGVYFSWNDEDVSVGWGTGIWRGQFDPLEGLSELDDSSYRLLLRAKIAANAWDGTVPGAYEIWEKTFGSGSTVLIQDNQDMSIVVGIANENLNSVSQALLLKGLLPLKPAGVRINQYVVSLEGTPLFAWNLDNGALAGWNEGSWAKNLLPN
jgi:hypothetical protein